MAVRLSGDAFWTYVLLSTIMMANKAKDGRAWPHYGIIPESKFGAYVLGESYEWQPSEREFYLLMAGEVTRFESQDVTRTSDGS